ncbi:MAG: PEP/pyruvate-binding domain-containing protein [Deltaproteobacteria bacterium]|nr:PEP/pyruvate-binding domain-containing protein [Deltaproteobacteria bacterium]
MFKFLRRFLREEQDPQVLLREKFHHFRILLESNNQVLSLMADMEEKASGDYLFDAGYLKSRVGQLGTQVARIIQELGHLTDNRYPELVPIHQEILAAILAELAATREIPATPWVLPLAQLAKESAPAVGAKMANLGEIQNRLGIRVPRGFAVTAAAYRHFLEESGLTALLEERLDQARIDDLESLEQISREVQELVRRAPLPPDLEEALRQAAATLAGGRLAVRSSAVGEDTDYSFAGQFHTLLNVDAADLPVHYKEVVASKFRPRAVYYWKYRQFSLGEVPMAVGCLVMVPARVSGIMFSRDPHAPEADVVIVNAVWGLGKYAVDGTITPDFYKVARSKPFGVLEQRVVVKPVALICEAAGGCRSATMPPEQAASACLTPAQLEALAEIAVNLEAHFGRPQDIEWAIDEQGEIIILQTRPLRVSAPAFGEAGREPVLELPPPLLSCGIRASGGAAAGPVFHLETEEDIKDIPPGAVVVARQSSARLVLVMDKISAIVTEIGGPTDHMSILAREFKVPALAEVKGAMQTLKPGLVVTVDADTAEIYPGVVRDLLERRQRTDKIMQDHPDLQKLTAILKKTVPLNLVDPSSPEFQAKNCRTFHDITRFSHEKAMDAMFFLDVEEAVTAGGVCRLKTELPLNIFILDLGGGLRVSGQAAVTEDDISSRPFRALLRGFHHPEVRWAGQVAPDLKGFISVWANTMYDMAKHERGLGGKSFAIITENYLNFNSRLGYHFGLVDAYLSEERNDNYISFQFKGGAASVDRRERRARLLEKILSSLGFKVQITGDLVQGRLAKYSAADSEEMLEMTGLVMAFARQLDLALSSEAVVDRCLAAFKAKDYGLSCLRPDDAARGN